MMGPGTFQTVFLLRLVLWFGKQSSAGSICAACCNHMVTRCGLSICSNEGHCARAVIAITHVWLMKQCLAVLATTAQEKQQQAASNWIRLNPFIEHRATKTSLSN
jgi:hypothetical protein